MPAYLRSGWIDVVSSPPVLKELQAKVAASGFNDDTLTDPEVLQLSIVAQKFSAYLLVTSVHIFVLILKASICYETRHEFLCVPSHILLKIPTAFLLRSSLSRAPHSSPAIACFACNFILAHVLSSPLPRFSSACALTSVWDKSPTSSLS